MCDHASTEDDDGNPSSLIEGAIINRQLVLGVSRAGVVHGHSKSSTSSSSNNRAWNLQSSFRRSSAV